MYFTATSPGFSQFAITGLTSGSTGTQATAIQVHAETFGIPVKSPGAKSAEHAAPGPVGRESSSVPAPAETGFPLTTAALIGVWGIGIIGGGQLIRRWWIRRKDPTLFR